MRHRVIFVVLCVGLALTSSRVVAAPGDLLLTIPNPNPNPPMDEYFGRTVAGLGDGFVVAYPSEDLFGHQNVGSVHFYDTEGELLRSIPNPAPTHYGAFGITLAADGGNVAVASRDGAYDHEFNAIYYFDGTSGELLQTIREPDGVDFKESLLAGRGRIIVPTHQRSAAVFDAATGALQFKLAAPIDGRRIAAAAVSENGYMLGADYENVYLFDDTTGDYQSTIASSTRNTYIGDVLLGPQGSIVVIYVDGVVRVIDGSTFETTNEFSLHSLGDAEIAGNHLIIGECCFENLRGIVRIYDLEAGELVLSLNEPSGNDTQLFGGSIAAASQRIMVGAMRADINTGEIQDAGAVYLFEGFPLQSQPGDTNGDGLVDLEDLNNVRNNFGGTGLGDTDGNGTIDLADLNNVRNHFGESVPSNNSVPETQSWTLALAGAIAFLASFRLRSSQK